MTTHLYHGPGDSKVLDILSEGIDGPSYWGTLSEASSYATSDGKLFRVAINRFDLDHLKFNDLLAQSIVDSGDEAPLSGTWEESLERFDSVRYDITMPVEEMELVLLEDLENDAANPLP